MAKTKESRIGTILECKTCRENITKTRKGVSRYITSKNRKTTTSKLELSKYCKYCDKHTLHKEVK